jgi:RimJ/RimL family protein N-acetyltransferase
VDALPNDANAASRAVCESVGMQLEGIMRNERIMPAGELRHTCMDATVA